MQSEFYFTRIEPAPYASDLIDALEGALTDIEYSDEPIVLADGTLYRVTIEKVGAVRTTKEVEFDSAKQEASD